MWLLIAFLEWRNYAALMMQLGAENNYVGSGIFKSADPERRALAIVEAMPGLEIANLEAAGALLQDRGA